MKKVKCSQIRALTEDELKSVNGGMSRSDAIQTAISGDTGCGAGARAAQGSTSGRSRVICTHFYRKGMIEKDVWRADLEYTQNHLTSTTVRGYHFWAVPYVELMRKNSLYEKIMFPLAKYRAIELAYQMNVLDKGSFRGKLIRLIMEPICFMIGLFCEQKDWEKLWVNQ